ncbi:LPXTG cell wall anchor domain-containing protein [Paeniglutamicibacter sp. NPDC091659]|uniref:LPXTG cell wall anchor domain-containing protein n=1 Tax=Paeniglutamicibacter sp. NPDC091659 TaxID=3364389 RepID=UPI003818DE6E
MMSTKSMSTRCASIASVLGAAAIAFTALAAPASAAPAPDTKDVIALSWDGDEYTSVIGGSFVGVPVAVPGDSATRTLFVRNDGPSAGTLNASIVNVKILDPNAPDTKDNGKGAEDQGNFYDDLRLAWNGGSANFTTLASRPETEIYDVPVAQGQTVPITIDYRFPIEATSGNRANVSAREASFDVRLTISGDDDPDLPGTETAAPPTDPTATPPSEDPEPSESHPGKETNAPGTDPAGTPDDPAESHPGTLDTKKPQAKPPLANTGAEIWGAVVAGLGLVGLGWLFAARGRRKGKHSN